MGTQDPIMQRMAEGIGMGEQGERDEARRRFTELWAEVGADGDSLHRCGIAHSMADVCDDAAEELEWDLRALHAAESISDKRVWQAGMAGSARALYPSLHLNVAEAYRKTGNVELAREHLVLGKATSDALPDDGYGQMIRAGLDRLAVRLDPASAAGGDR